MRPRRFLQCVIGRRGVALLFFALLDFVYAFSLVAPTADARQTENVRFLESIAPLPAFGALWFGVGLVCLGSAFRRQDRWGFAAAMFIKILWGAIFLIGAYEGVPRAFLAATIWLCLAGWIAVISTWPEPPDPICDDWR